MTDEKTGRPLGPTGEAVRRNIKRIREGDRMPVTELSARLEALGRPIPPLGLRRIEDGKRRVDADDLLALAAALSVPPATLLMPSIGSVAGRDQVELTGVPSPIPAEEAWDWLTAQDTLEHGHAEVLLAFYQRAWPQWKQEEVAARYRASLNGRQF